MARPAKARRDRAIKALIVVVALVALTVLLLPLAVSGSFVRERIVERLAQATGGEVEATSTSFRFWPSPRVAIEGITITGMSGREGATLAARRALVRVPLSSVLARGAQPDEVVLEGADLRWPVPPPARDQAPTSVAAATPSIAPLVVPAVAQAKAFGLRRVRLVDGRVRWGGRSFTVADLDLARSGGGVSVAGEVVWRDERVTLEASLDDVDRWASGAGSASSLTVSSAPMTLAFRGQARPAQLTGSLTLETPSVQRVLLWLDVPSAATAPRTAVSLSGEVNGSPRALAFRDASVGIGKANGAGSIEIVRQAGDRLAASGTLAFGEIALAAGSIAPLLASGEGERFALDELGPFDLDLRFSADTLKVGGLTLSDIAAGIISKRGDVRLDVGDASVLGGTMEASLRTRSAGGDTASAVRVQLNGVEWPPAILRTGEGSPGLRGRADLSIALTGDSGAVPAGLSGSGRLRMSTGAISQVDLPAIVAAARAAEMPSQRAIWTGETPFQTLDLPFTMERGVIAVRDGEVESNNYRTKLTGRVDLVRQSVALRGTSRLRARESDAADFFVGGTIRAPLVVPVSAAVVPPTGD